MVLERGPIRFEADSLTAEWADNELFKVTATGQPAKFVRKADPERGVSEATASARTIVYMIRDSQVELREQASLKQAGTSVTGDVITYDLANQELAVDSQTDRQAEIIYHPDPK